MAARSCSSISHLSPTAADPREVFPFANGSTPAHLCYANQICSTQEPSATCDAAILCARSAAFCAADVFCHLSHVAISTSPRPCWLFMHQPCGQRVQAFVFRRMLARAAVAAYGEQTSQASCIFRSRERKRHCENFAPVRLDHLVHPNIELIRMQSFYELMLPFSCRIPVSVWRSRVVGRNSPRSRLQRPAYLMWKWEYKLRLA